MSFPRYPEYKDSGVAWLGEVPGHWEVKRIKNVALVNMGQSPSSEDCNQEGSGVPFLQGNADFGETYPLPRHYCAVANKNAQVDDILFSVRAPVGAINIADQVYGIGRGLCALTPKADTSQRYLFHSLQLAKEELFSVATGSTYEAVSVEQIGNARCLLPTPDEQSAIAAFLDRETGKIDALVSEQEKLIALLKEKRQAVISHAVTKGLNPAAPMKDSGIEWLGEVPEHWEVIPFKKGIDFQEGPGIMAADFHDEGIPLLRVSGVQARWAALEGCNYLDPEKVEKQWNHFRLVRGDLLISASASMGTVCEVDGQTVGAIPYTGLIRLRGKDSVMTRSFVRSLVISSLFSIQIDLLKAGSTIQHFGPTHLSQMKVICPSVIEQEEIAKFIDYETAKFDALVAEAEHAIELLKERRSALISAAVTGKIDVRGFVAEERAVA